MGIDQLLSRLSAVKPNGNARWVARCPAHEDKHPSLAVRVLDDGRILLHCFAGCGAVDVIESLGLAMSDLFPESLTRQRLPKVHAPFSAMDALRCLAFESSVVAIASSRLTLGEVLTDADSERLATSAGRIAAALEVIHG